MGLSDRFFKIAKSYLNSASDTIGEELDGLSQKWNRGELTDEMIDRLRSIKRNLKISDEDQRNLSDEEVDQILKDNGYNKSSSNFANDRKSGARTTPPTQQQKLDNAYKRLGVSPSDPWPKIEKAYKKQLMQFHPDRFPGDESKSRMATKLSQMISEAYQTIKTLRGK